MAYPYTQKLTYPVKSWQKAKKKYKFGKEYSYKNEKGKKINWGKHLGEDVNLKAGTSIFAIGRGKVVKAKFYLGKDKDHRNWGGIVIIAHKNPRTKKPFF